MRPPSRRWTRAPSSTTSTRSSTPRASPLIVRPSSVDELSAAGRVPRGGAEPGSAVAVAGGRHAMGGQQFVEDGLLVDTRGLDRVLAFDEERGIIHVEGGRAVAGNSSQQSRRGAGRSFPPVGHLPEANRRRLIEPRRRARLAMRTGGDWHWADRRSRSSVRPPSGPAGDVRRCSPHREPELFRLTIGGYGLFGIVAPSHCGCGRASEVRRVVDVGARRRASFNASRRAFATAISTATISSRPMRRATAFSRAACSRATSRWRRRRRSRCTRQGSIPRTGRASRSIRTNTSAARSRVYSTRYLRTSGQVYRADSQLLRRVRRQLSRRPGRGARREDAGHGDDHGNLCPARLG